ncbi:transmembrane protein [Salix suchowensis]|nr:transmembrane protein [Salix suchowensis]
MEKKRDNGSELKIRDAGGDVSGGSEVELIEELGGEKRVAVVDLRRVAGAVVVAVMSGLRCRGCDAGGCEVVGGWVVLRMETAIRCGHVRRGIGVDVVDTRDGEGDGVGVEAGGEAGEKVVEEASEDSGCEAVMEVVEEGVEDSDEVAVAESEGVVDGEEGSGDDVENDVSETAGDEEEGSEDGDNGDGGLWWSSELGHRKLIDKPSADPPPPPPPAFDIAEALPLPVAGGEEPPPEFTPYDAEFFFIDSDNIVSHDPHLNTDGEALYRFLLSQSSTPPTYRIHCHGSHTETRSRWVTHEHNGKYESRHESYSETITDFDFYIDVSQSLLGTDATGPLMWSVSDSEPSYRGSMVRQVLVPDGLAKRKREGTAEEISAHKRWSSERASRGMPPWMTGVPSFQWTEGTPDIPNGAPPSSILRSSRTLREWADDYCASNKLLKEFVFEKVLYGWNVASLSSAIQSAIAASPYSGHIKAANEALVEDHIVDFIDISVCVAVQEVPSAGGGRWEVCGGAYALKRWVPVDADEDMGGNETRRDEKQPYVPEASTSAASPSEPLPPPAFHTLQMSPSPLVDLSNANYTRSLSRRPSNLAIRLDEFYVRRSVPFSRVVVVQPLPTQSTPKSPVPI